MPEAPFTNREIVLMFEGIKTTQSLHSLQNESMLKKLDYTNGRVRRLYLYLTVVGAVTGTLLITSGSELVNFILKII